MSKFKVYVGVNYEGTPASNNLEFEPDSAHQVGAVIGKVIEDEPNAINFQILVQKEDNDGKADG